jgi:hypothetical protein
MACRFDSRSSKLTGRHIRIPLKTVDAIQIDSMDQPGHPGSLNQSVGNIERTKQLR